MSQESDDRFNRIERRLKEISDECDRLVPDEPDDTATHNVQVAKNTAAIGLCALYSGCLIEALEALAHAERMLSKGFCQALFPDWDRAIRSKETFKSVQSLGPKKRSSKADERRKVLRKFVRAHFSEHPGDSYYDAHAAAKQKDGPVGSAIEHYKNGESLRKAVGGQKRIALARSKL